FHQIPTTTSLSFNLPSVLKWNPTTAGLLLLNDDAPESTRYPLPPQEPIITTNSSSPEASINSSTSATAAFKRSLILQPSPPFDSNIAYTILVILTALSFLGFFSVYICQFAENSSVAMSSRRRRRRRRRQRSSFSEYHRSSSTASHRGLDPDTIHSLPVYEHHEDTKHRVDCAICLSEFEEAEAVKMIPYCKHVFHPECIDTWLFSHLTCPVCRSTRLSEVKWDGGLGVIQPRYDHGVNDRVSRTTVEILDTCSREPHERTTGVRKSWSTSNSSSSFGDQVMMRRVLSF
ncbi:putative Ring finger protein, partial [Quillaja saponaria]